MNRRKLAGLFSAGLMAISAGLAMAGPAQAATPAKPAAATVKPFGIGAAVVLQNRASGKCLDVARGSLQLAAVVWSWSCDTNNSNQNWLIESALPGWVSLRNLHSNLCLDLRAGTGNPVHNGTTAQQWDCFPGSISTENWQLNVSPVVPGYLTIPTQSANGLCLEVAGGSGANGAAVQVATCAGPVDRQLWRILS